MQLFLTTNTIHTQRNLFVYQSSHWCPITARIVLL